MEGRIAMDFATIRSMTLGQTTVARVVSVVALAAVTASAQSTSRVSVDSAGNQADSWSFGAAVSSDGSLVAFASDASNLVVGDTNGDYDVFVRDRGAGTTERMSVRSTGKEANGDSYEPGISGDGSIVAFTSASAHLVNSDMNGVADVFVHDRTTGKTERVSIDSSGVEGNGSSFHPYLSFDGRYVAFVSSATNLVPGDTNGRVDVFVRDRLGGTTERVSVDSSGSEADGDSGEAVLSSDGSIVAFSSRATNFDSNPAWGFESIFVHDRNTGATERQSVDSSGVAPADDSRTPAISGDGMVVAFVSTAKTLVSGDKNWMQDVFVHDRVTGATTRVSVDSNGIEGNMDSYPAALSADGRIVAFASDAWNLVDGDSDPQGGNGFTDVFLHERSIGVTLRVSVDSSGNAGDRNCGNNGLPDIGLSGDGAVVAFAGSATNLATGDTNGADDVFVHEATIADASWANYGAGFGGTTGVPAFTASGNPVLGTPISLDVGNSSGTWSVALVIVGAQSASIPTRAGGTLLVAPLWSVLIALTPSGGSLPGVIPVDPTLLGVSLFTQALELDSGAAYGLSFTPGLQLIFGR
jgi:Tol biopolymer transport system component